MNADVETFIRQNCAWAKLPPNIKEVLGNSQKEYNKWVFQFSIKNQLRYRGNIVRHVEKNEKSYYEELLRYSREHLMLFPYHLSDFIVTSMRLTPFQYYISIMQDLLEQERSYDSLPNFTAADCLRLLGIGRNQYIDLMNQCRSSKKFFGVRKKPIRDLLPTKPVSSVPIEPWWLVQVGYVTEDDIRLVSPTERQIIDRIIDNGAQRAGDVILKDVKSLYSKGLVYLDVPVEDDDYFIVPPLEGFVMNRVLGDYFENLLYQIFVSIDEHTTVAELTNNVLRNDLQLIKNVVSMYCRLGFARKKGVEINDEKYHVSWRMHSKIERTRSKEIEDFFSSLNTETEGILVEDGTPLSTPRTTEAPVSMSDLLTSVTTHSKRIGFLFDSTLTAFLMMGNLSSGLKSHAVTMFEVGKLSDESLDSFLLELEKVCDVGEGEAQRYFHHALTLRSTILFLRHNTQMLINESLSPEEEPPPAIGPALDLIRCESLQNLETDTCNRLLNKNYSLLVSMAPLTNEIRPVTSCKPPHLGPSIPEVNSVWFKLFVYTLTELGPPSLLLAKGTRLRVLPRIFRMQDRLLITPWGHDPGNVPTANALMTLNDALCHSAVLIQGQGSGGELSYVPFPLDEKKGEEKGNLRDHPAIETLSQHIDLRHTCGYITLMRLGRPPSSPQPNKGPIATATVTTHSTCSSSSTSPINGIKDNISKELLASELDKLALEEQPLPISGVQDAVSPCNEVRVTVTPGEGMQGNGDVKLPKLEDNWVLLDCSFGVPLFDADLNKEVCQKVVKFKLCQHDSLNELMQSSRKMILQLLDFIAKHQNSIGSDRNVKRFTFPARKGEHDLPLPTQNLLYINGRLGLWDGS